MVVPDREYEIDAVFVALSDPLRRAVLSHLHRKDGDVATVSELSEQVTGSNERLDPGWVSTRLHHVHLPKLDEMGFVEYDPRSDTVRFRAHEVLASVLAASVFDA